MIALAKPALKRLRILYRNRATFLPDLRSDFLLHGIVVKHVAWFTLCSSFWLDWVKCSGFYQGSLLRWRVVSLYLWYRYNFSYRILFSWGGRMYVAFSMLVDQYILKYRFSHILCWTGQPQDQLFWKLFLNTSLFENLCQTLLSQNMIALAK